jgi:4'-phosphopantetheinyl transferase EntD
VIEALLPGPVATAEAFVDPPDGTLFAEEEAVIAGAVDKRRLEFTTVRLCARTALASVGVAPAPLVPGPHGAPGWPAGVVGSMTHCDGYRAAAVARVEHMVTIGLDAEPHEPLPGEILSSVMTDGEHRRLAALAARQPGICWDRLLFSAKESVYKAWFPLAGRWLDFAEAEVTFDPAGGTFAARLLVAGPVVDGAPLTGFTGRWLVRDGLAVTAIAVPVPSVH